MHEGGLLPLLIAGLFGALIGSFLNVCIYRLPRRESIAWPGSHCPKCSHPIAWYDNIPILSYLALAGRCRRCTVPISFRYPLVEILNAAGYVSLLWFFGRSWVAVAYGLLYSALLVVA
jgi:leader peptidase (prepilin peptidase)/N-methyltransferase